MARASTTPILHRCDPDEIRSLRAQSRFFWADLRLAKELTAERVADAFGLSPGALATLGHFGSAQPPRVTRRYHVDDECVVFPFWCALEPGPGPLVVFQVNVVLHGDYLLTVHTREYDLPQRLVGGELPKGRTERYAVYAALDGMIDTTVDALADIAERMAELQDLMFSSEPRPRRDEGTVRDLRTELTHLRIRLGPERSLFERIGEEIEHIPGLEADREKYFDRIQRQLDHTVEGIDAAGDSLSHALEIQTNEVMARLTIVATIFLPLTLITGFFGMNFEWMVSRIHSGLAFWLLGVGSIVLVTAVITVMLLGRPERPGHRAR